jgi:hypothetical protein
MSTFHDAKDKGRVKVSLGLLFVTFITAVFVINHAKHLKKNGKMTDHQKILENFRNS